ncbi:trypsin-like peptidase domain-containing protein [Tropicibacter naphthalenivorans]|uniref:V8-like Glu-specific endopeptidase n=1 Tax=Tropicibacter naphthalenivorans TaxID=441103 RepID=A0A0P1H1J0_9RHOB|nr:trypsin-like peptidase domain-containing protein [Tropicibacter naphthalenivorans]CUH80727.1 V8-like Glu-specific endopeptidase [Tropicibacter naphthalenivorans]SMC89674.1 Putative peptidoglycan binding domain-containing protein [Tropicibacter naphthalenivorans]
MKRAAMILAGGMALAQGAQAQDLLMFDASTFGNTVLSRNQSALPGAEFEAQIGDYNNEFVSNYGATSVFARTGRPIGRLDILTDKGHAPCTAFLVEGNRLVTNHHCVPGILNNEKLGASAIIAVQLRMGYLRDGIEEGTRMFHVNPAPLETSEALDYSVLQVVGGDANAEFGALELSSVLPSDRDPLWVIGHPMGEAQRISREKCQADSPAVASGRLRHTCDTLPGNSGSPVIDTDLKQVVALHHAGSRAGAVNFAVPMADILRQSKVLKAAVRGDVVLDDIEAERQRLEAEKAALADERARILAEAEAAKAAAAKASAQQADSAAARATAERESLANAALLDALGQAEVSARAVALRAVIDDHPATMAAQAAELALTQLRAPSEADAPAKPAPDASPTRFAALLNTPVPDPGAGPALSPEETEAALSLGRDDYRDIQRTLDALGYGLGEPDGLFGPASRSAVRAFQKENLIEETGYLSANLLDRIADEYNAAPATLDGTYRIFVRRRWDDAYFRRRPDPAYRPGKIETLGSVAIKVENGRTEVLGFQDLSRQKTDAYKDLRVSLDAQGRLKLRSTINFLFGKVRPKVLNLDEPLAKRWATGRAITFEDGEWDEAFHVNIRVLRSD